MRFEIRIGHNKTDTREELTNMPFDLTDNPSGLIPFLRLVMKLDHPNLYAALWRTTGGPLQVRQDVSLQTIVAGKPNEVGDTTPSQNSYRSGPAKAASPLSQNCLNQDL